MTTPLERQRILARKVTEYLAHEASKVFEELEQLKDLKGLDYDRLGPITDRMPFGDASFCHEVYKKANRLVALLGVEGPPVNESIDETIADIAVYCAFWIAARRAGLVSPEESAE